MPPALWLKTLVKAPKLGPDLHRSDTLSTVSPGPRIHGRQQLPGSAQKYSIVLHPPGATAAAVTGVTPVPAWETSLTVTHGVQMKRWCNQGASTGEAPPPSPPASCSQAGFGVSREMDSSLPEARKGTGATAVQPRLACRPLLCPSVSSTPQPSASSQIPTSGGQDKPPLPSTPTHGCQQMAFSSQSLQELYGLHRPPDPRPPPSQDSPLGQLINTSRKT